MNVRLLPLMLLGLSSLAQAAELPECSGTTEALTGSDTTLTAFIPNAPCLIMENVQRWSDWGLWQAMAGVGLTMTAALFFYSVFRAVVSKTPEKAVYPLVIAVVVAMFLTPATKGQGPIPLIQAEAINSFNSLYRASTAVGQADLNDEETGVKAKTAKLGRNIALLIARASHGQAIQEQLALIKAGKQEGDLSDPNLVNQMYAERIANENAAADDIFNTSSNSWVFNVGFLLLHGLFAIFAAIIASVAWVVQLVLLIFPVGLSFLVIGNYQPVRYMGVSYLGGLLTIALLPLMVSSVASLGLSIPADRLTPHLSSMNADMLATLQRSQELIRQGCGLTDISCSLEKNIFNKLLADLDTMKEMFMNTLMLIMGLLVGLTIAATGLRRVPATLSGMFGGSGGGESSGVETGSFGKAFSAMTGASLIQKAVQARMMGAMMNKGKQNAGGEGASGGVTGVASTGAGSASTGSVANVPPPSVTAGDASAAPTGDIPPTEVTGGPSNAGGSGGFIAGMQSGAGMAASLRMGAGNALRSAGGAAQRTMQGAFAADKAKSQAFGAMISGPRVQAAAGRISGGLQAAGQSALASAQAVQDSPKAPPVARAAAAGMTTAFTPPAAPAAKPELSKGAAAVRATGGYLTPPAIKDMIRGANAAEDTYAQIKAEKQAADAPPPPPAPPTTQERYTAAPGQAPAAYTGLAGTRAAGSPGGSAAGVPARSVMISATPGTITSGDDVRKERPELADQASYEPPAPPPPAGVQGEVSAMQGRLERGPAPDITKIDPARPAPRAVYSSTADGKGIPGVATGPLTPPAPPTPPTNDLPRPPSRIAHVQQRTNAATPPAVTPPPVVPPAAPAKAPDTTPTPPPVARPPRR